MKREKGIYYIKYRGDWLFIGGNLHDAMENARLFL